MTLSPSSQDWLCQSWIVHNKRNGPFTRKQTSHGGYAVEYPLHSVHIDGKTFTATQTDSTV